MKCTNIGPKICCIYSRRIRTCRIRINIIYVSFSSPSLCISTTNTCNMTTMIVISRCSSCVTNCIRICSGLRSNSKPVNLIYSCASCSIWIQLKFWMCRINISVYNNYVYIGSISRQINFC